MTTNTASNLSSWAESDISAPVPFWSSLYADMKAHVSLYQRSMSMFMWVLTLIWITLRSGGFHAVLLYRLAHTSRAYMGLPGKLLSGICGWIGRHWCGCTLASTARLYGGLILPHPQGIVVGPGVVVGPRSWILQNVTLGGVPSKNGMPHIGADARIFARAVVVGPMTLGDNVMIGANAVVSEDICSRTLVRHPTMELTPLPERFLAKPE